MKSYRSAMALTGVLLSGCSVTRFGNSFEGANDFRIIPLLGPNHKVPEDCPSKAAVKTIPNDAERPVVNIGCFSRFQYHPNPNTPSNSSFFEKDDKITIFMKSMRFAFFSEGWAEQWSNQLFRSPVKGEIAIVANVTQGARTPGGRNSDGQLEGKVVFFSKDILAGQQANEFNIPIYGPVNYDGGALTIELWALELDEVESKQFGPVLKTLSQLSASFLGLPGSANQVLSRVGSAFLNSNRDDVIGHIAFTLVPPQPGLTATDPLLQVSDILVHRNENGQGRDMGVPFDACYYEPLQAKVSCQGTDALKTPDRNSFALSIRKWNSTVPLVSDLTLKDLNERLERASSLGEVNKIIQDNADELAGRATYQASIEAISRMANTQTPAAVRSNDAEQILSVLQCALIANRTANADPAGAAQWTKTYTDNCGGSALSRAATMAEFNSLGRKMIELLAFESAQLSEDALIADTPKQTRASLLTLRKALLPYAKPRPTDPAAPAASAAAPAT